MKRIEIRCAGFYDNLATKIIVRRESTWRYRVITVTNASPPRFMITTPNMLCVLQFTRLSDTLTAVETELWPTQVHLTEMLNTIQSWVPTDIGRCLDELRAPRKIELITPIVVLDSMKQFVQEINWPKQPFLHSALLTYNQYFLANKYIFDNYYLVDGKPQNKTLQVYEALTPTVSPDSPRPNLENFNHRVFWELMYGVYPVEFRLFYRNCMAEKQIKERLNQRGYSSIHGLFAQLPLCQLINSYFTLAPENYFEESRLFSEQERKQAAAGFDANCSTHIAQRGNLVDFIAISTIQLLKSFNIPQDLSAYCYPDETNPDNTSYLVEKLSTLLKQPRYKYIYFVIRTREENYAAVVINIPHQKIYCVDPYGNRLTYIHKNEETNSLDEALKLLRGIIGSTPLLRSFSLVLTPPQLFRQSTQDNVSCAIHCIMIMVGIILTKEAPAHCPDLIKIDPETGHGIVPRDAHINELSVVAQIAQQSFKFEKYLSENPQSALSAEEDEKESKEALSHAL